MTILDAIRARATDEPQKPEQREPEYCDSCGGRNVHRLPCRQYERELLAGCERLAAKLTEAKADRRLLLGIVERMRGVVKCSAMASKPCPDVFDREDWCEECNTLALLTEEQSTVTPNRVP